MNILERFKHITTFIFDVDGVMTDGSIGIVTGNEYIRTMNTKDGYALQLAVKRGYRVAVITGGYVPAVVERMASLGVREVYHKVHNKIEYFNEYCKQYNIVKDEILYMGDDIPDRDVMQASGLACCPADAVPEIKSIAHYISPFNGGKGCVRDVIEKVLKIKGNWDLSTAISSI
ncbi:MAG: HAD hydrolase family protein [Chitinophagaceae bacterium]|nr:HAD hydrolase family protein [Chitinophagaceae bacterium]